MCNMVTLHVTMVTLHVTYIITQDIGDYSKRELLEQLRILRREKGECEVTIKQLRCDTANEKRKQDKVIKDLMSQIRGFHMPVQRQESTGILGISYHCLL